LYGYRQPQRLVTAEKKRLLMTSLRSLLDGDVDVSEYPEVKEEQQEELLRAKA
jgi:hypothetical protein